MRQIEFDDDDRTVCAVCGRAAPCACALRNKRLYRDAYAHKQRFTIVAKHQ